jgi:hypothetical protein
MCSIDLLGNAVHNLPLNAGMLYKARGASGAMSRIISTGDENEKTAHDHF